MNEELSQLERENMRATLVKGAWRVAPARMRTAHVVGVGAVIALVGGVGGVLWLSGTRTGPVASPSPSLSSVGAPTACLRYEGSQPSVDPEARGIVSAASQAQLPPGIIISPEVTAQQTSGGAATTFDVVVRVCSERLTRSELTEVGDRIASAMYRSNARANVATLTIQSWVVIGSDAIAKDPSGVDITTDFQKWDWSTVPPDSDAWR